MVDIKYANAYTEVLEILKYISVEDYNKIPKNKIELFQTNANNDYHFTYTPEKTLNEQNVSKIAKGIIAILFRDYWATNIQKEKIIKKQNYDRHIIEESKIEFNPNDLFKRKKVLDSNETYDKNDIYNQPDKNEIIAILDHLLAIVYPGFFREKSHKIYNLSHTVSTLIEDVLFHLNKQIMVVMKYTKAFSEEQEEELEEFAQNASVAFLKTIPKIREYLDTDLQAALDGDPAASSKEEIIFSYPGLYAITVYRLAHELFLLKVPLIPRMMTEHAHSKTGIDIHPGATIGKYFFIDHGTGIVVGETTVIGEHVKLYQGVTLGALSTKGGQKLRHVRRHPTICDNVTIYSGASILGGNTVIEEGVVVGGNAFITKSVSKGTKVSVKNQELIYHSDDESLHQAEQDESWFYVI